VNILLRRTLANFRSSYRYVSHMFMRKNGQEITFVVPLSLFDLFRKLYRMLFYCLFIICFVVEPHKVPDLKVRTLMASHEMSFCSVYGCFIVGSKIVTVEKNVKFTCYVLILTHWWRGGIAHTLS
jgi:hypothetical protein